MMATPIYGLSYEPLGNINGDIGAWYDYLPPVALAKYFGGKVDNYIDTKAAHAGSVAAAQVQQGVRKAVGETARGVGTFLAGGIVLGAIAGGIYYYRKSREEQDGR